MTELDRCRSSRDVQLFCREWNVAAQQEARWENALQQFLEIHPDFEFGEVGKKIRNALLKFGLEHSPSLENLETAYQYVTRDAQRERTEQNNG